MNVFAGSAAPIKSSLESPHAPTGSLSMGVDYWKDIRELVDPETFRTLGPAAWSLIDPRLHATLNQLKARYGWTIIVNTWFMKNWQRFGEKWTYRCFRPSGVGVGKPNGAHYKGMGVDFDAYGPNGLMIPADLVRKQILSDIEFFPHIRCMETGINWVHIDVMGDKDSPIKRGLGTDISGLVASCNENYIMLVNRNNTFDWFDRRVKAA